MNSKVSRSLVAVAVLGALPVGLATSAQAGPPVTANGCSVWAAKPFDTDRVNDNGIEVIQAYFRVECKGGRSIKVQQRIYEGVDDLKRQIGDTRTEIRHFRAGSGLNTTRIRSHFELPDTETGPEEVWQEVRFQVVVHGDAKDFTKWFPSGTAVLGR